MFFVLWGRSSRFLFFLRGGPRETPAAVGVVSSSQYRRAFYGQNRSPDTPLPVPRPSDPAAEIFPSIPRRSLPSSWPEICPSWAEHPCSPRGPSPSSPLEPRSTCTLLSRPTVDWDLPEALRTSTNQRYTRSEAFKAPSCMRARSPLRGGASLGPTPTSRMVPMPE